MKGNKIQTFVQPNQNWSKGVEFVLSLFKPVLNIEFEFLNTQTSDCFLIHFGSEKSPIIHEEYWAKLSTGEFKACHQLFCQLGENFLLEKIFHLVNCVQEYTDDGYENYVRFNFQQSWQYQQNNVTQNIVLQLMEKFLHQCFPWIQPIKRTSKFFLSHDIDTLHGELLQNGKYYLQTFQLHKLKSSILNYLLNRPGWANMDEINKLHEEYGVKHVYFWLVEKGKKNNVINSDYSLKDLKRYSQKCASNGLHKSSASSNYSNELAKLPFTTIANRNHFLRYRLPRHWDQLESSSIKIDASMGFAEHFGFRNSYGYPFRPYNCTSQKCYSHVSVPLNIMDATFRNYLKTPLEETAETIIRFIEENKTGAILSILWHNTFFTDGKYEGYSNQYIKILQYLNDNQFETLDINDLELLEVN